MSKEDNSTAAIQAEVEKIIEAGALGKSDAYVRLLRYLGKTAQTGKSVKEIEIAIEVFGRDETFDVTQDSLIRVYIHKLRTKLDTFYRTTESNHPDRLVIPKGSYLLQLEKNEAGSRPTPILAKLATWQPLTLIFASMLLGALALSVVQFSINKSRTNDLAVQSPIWSPLVEQDKPLLIAVGDIFMYSEVTAEYEQLREIRDFSIANSEQFQDRLNSDLSFSENYRDFGVRYLPSALGSTLKQIIDFLGPDSSWEITLTSQLDKEDIDQFNILYLGYYTALDKLAHQAFTNSSLMLHPNGNVLIEDETGEVFVGSGQLGEGYRDRYVDYGVFRKTTLESGNSLYLLMSARDPGLENLVAFVFSDEGTSAIQAQLKQPQGNFEILLEVSGDELDDLTSQVRLLRQTD